MYFGKGGSVKGLCVLKLQLEMVFVKFFLWVFSEYFTDVQWGHEANGFSSCNIILWWRSLIKPSTGHETNRLLFCYKPHTLFSWDCGYHFQFYNRWSSRGVPTEVLCIIHISAQFSTLLAGLDIPSLKSGWCLLTV